MTLSLSASILNSLSSKMQCPSYSRVALTQGVMHIGVGAFHRSHQARYLDELIASHGAQAWAICGVGIMPQDDAINQALQAQNGLYTLLERSHIDGKLISTARIIGSLTEYIWGYRYPDRVFEKMRDSAIKIVSLTATEGGYYLDESTGELQLSHPNIQHDLMHPEHPKTIFGYLSKGLDDRRRNGQRPFTVLSCDNIQSNGHILKKLLLAFCAQKDQVLADWVARSVSFPNSMVDRITPAATEQDRLFIEKEYGYWDACPVVSECFKQWVIEDDFCNDRPPLEKVGVQFTSNVAAYEKMKIRLLNASHSAMGYLGYLCGYRFIHDVAQASEFVPYIRKLMDVEMTPLIGAVEGINLNEYKQTLMGRFSNILIQDQALRICMDGSGKMPKYIFPSIHDQLARGGEIRQLTLCVASWMRFLTGIDEQGQSISIVDPQAERLTQLAQEGRENPALLLSQKDIFGTLGESERFVAELKLLLAMLYDKGAQHTLAFCLSSV